MKSSRAARRRRMLAWMLGAGLLAPPAAGATPALPDSSARTAPAVIFRADRLQHVSLALTLGLGSGLLSRRPAIALAVPLTLGLAKEVRDRHVTRFDPADLAADLIGAAMAAALVRHLER